MRFFEQQPQAIDAAKTQIAPFTSEQTQAREPRHLACDLFAAGAQHQGQIVLARSRRQQGLVVLDSRHLGPLQQLGMQAASHREGSQTDHTPCQHPGQLAEPLNHGPHDQNIAHDQCFEFCTGKRCHQAFMRGLHLHGHMLDQRLGRESTKKETGLQITQNHGPPAGAVAADTELAVDQHVHALIGIGPVQHLSRLQPVPKALPRQHGQPLVGQRLQPAHAAQPLPGHG